MANFFGNSYGILILGLSIIISFLSCGSDDELVSDGQMTYFPSLDNTEAWESVSPLDLDWELSYLPAIDSFLRQTDTRSFMIIKGGKIAYEAYFNTDLNGLPYSASSTWPSGDLSRSLFSLGFGVFLDQEAYDLQGSSSALLTTSWNGLSLSQQSAIRFQDHLGFTAGLKVLTGQEACTDSICFEFEMEPGQQWKEHPALYWVLADSMQLVIDGGLDAFFETYISQPIGASGSWVKNQYSYDYYTTARSLARLALLTINNGNWDGNTLLEDQEYLNHLVESSSEDNPAFAFHWWLNNGEGGILPYTQLPFEGKMIPDAPTDFRFAYGNSGEIILLNPTDQLIIVRQGNLPQGIPAHGYLLDLWTQIDLLLP